jgi:hypothetical protein
MSKIIINNVQRIQFIENVLGISLTSDETCLLIEGITPNTLKERIQRETLLYENFIDTLKQKIGAIPTSIQKTLGGAKDMLKFIWNVITDRTGGNLKRAIVVLTRNSRALFSRITRAIKQAPDKIKKILESMLDWIKTKVGTILGIQSDVDDKDEISNDGGNWKKFLLLLLVGCMLVALLNVGKIITDFGIDVATNGFTQIFDNTKDFFVKIVQEPELAVAATGGMALMNFISPLMSIYSSAKILTSIQGDLLDDNSWLKK